MSRIPQGPERCGSRSAAASADVGERGRPRPGAACRAGTAGHQARGGRHGLVPARRSRLFLRYGQRRAFDAALQRNEHLRIDAARRRRHQLRLVRLARLRLPFQRLAALRPDRGIHQGGVRGDLRRAVLGPESGRQLRAAPGFPGMGLHGQRLCRPRHICRHHALCRGRRRHDERQLGQSVPALRQFRGLRRRPGRAAASTTGASPTSCRPDLPTPSRRTSSSMSATAISTWPAARCSTSTAATRRSAPRACRGGTTASARARSARACATTSGRHDLERRRHGRSRGRPFHWRSHRRREVPRRPDHPCGFNGFWSGAAPRAGFPPSGAGGAAVACGKLFVAAEKRGLNCSRALKYFPRRDTPPQRGASI